MPREELDVYAVQFFIDDVWRTAYFTTYEPDASGMFFLTEDEPELAEINRRLVCFSGVKPDCLATNARDFAVVDKINF